MPGGVRLHHENCPETVDDETGQPVGLGMDEAIIGLVEQPLAQPQRAFEPARQESAGRSAGRRRDREDAPRAGCAD